MTIQQLTLPEDSAGYAVYEHRDGHYECVKLTWFHRLVRYFAPQRYDLVTHLPKISRLIQASIVATDFARLEKLFFVEVLQKEKLYAASLKAKERLNEAVRCLLGLREQFSPEPREILVQQFKALLKNPCDNPERFFVYTRGMKQEEQTKLLEKKELAGLAKELAERLFKRLSGQEKLVGTINISPKEYETGPLDSPEKWAKYVPNYNAVCHTLNRRPLSAVQINGQKLRNKLVREDAQKVPAVCSALLKRVQLLVPSLSLEACSSIVGQIVAQIAIELPNPISLPSYLVLLHNILSKEEPLYLHANKSKCVECSFKLNAESGSLKVTYETERGYSLKQEVSLKRVIFTSKVEKTFGAVQEDWQANLTVRDTP